MDQTSPPRPRLYYHGWNIVAVCILSQVACLALTLNCFSLFLRDWTHDFSVPVSTLAMAVTIFSFGCAVVAPIAGWAADRYPARWVFGLALAGLVGFHVAMGFATRAWQVVALYAAMLPIVITFAGIVPAQALVSRWFVRRVGLAMGITSFGLALASVIFPSLIVLLLPAIGWRMVWWIFAGVIALVILPLFLLVARNRPTAEDGAHYVGPRQAGPEHPALTARDVFSRRNFWVTIGVFVPIQCCIMGVQVNLAPIVASHGFSATNAGLILSASAIGGLTAKILSGLLADRLGNRIPLVLVSLICAAGVATLALAGARLEGLYAGAILLGLAGGVWTLLASATAAEFGPTGFGRAFGIIAAFTPIGAIAPPIVARLQETSGSYAAGLLGLAAFTVVGAGIALLMRERRGPAALPAAGLTPEAAE